MARPGETFRVVTPAPNKWPVGTVVKVNGLQGDSYDLEVISPGQTSGGHGFAAPANLDPMIESGVLQRVATSRRAALKVADFRPSELAFVAQGVALRNGLPASAGRVTKEVARAAERFALELGRALVPLQVSATAKASLERAAATDLALHAYWDVSGQRAGLVDALDDVPAREVQQIRRALHNEPRLRQAAEALDRFAEAAVRAR